MPAGLLFRCLLTGIYNDCEKCTNLYIVTCEKQRISAYRISNGQNPPIKFGGFALTSPKTCIYYTTIRMGVMIDVVHTIQSS